MLRERVTGGAGRTAGQRPEPRNWQTETGGNSPLTPQDSPPPHPQQRAGPLTALFLVTLVEAVGQPVALPGAGDAPAVAAHEVAWNVALVGEVVPREQLALCGRKGTGQ